MPADERLFQQVVDLVREIYGSGDVPLHRPVFAGDERDALVRCIDSNFVSSVGPEVRAFEEGIARHVGARHAVAAVNGTAALHMALLVAGVREDQEVLTQALTFVATCNAIRYCNAHPVFIDVDADTLGMSPVALEQFLEAHVEVRDGGAWNRLSRRRIAACLPMHTFGQPCRIEPIAALCSRYGIALVEDAAESLGSYVGDRHTGTFGLLGTLSFNGNKVITTGGGGMLVTDDDGLADRARHLTTTAKLAHPWAFVHDEVGYNYRMPNLNATLGVSQLARLPWMLEEKRKVANRYRAFFGGLEGVRWHAALPGTTSNHWLNAIWLEDADARDAFLAYTNARGVMTRPTWRLMTELPMYRACWNDGVPNAEAAQSRVVNLPSSVPASAFEGGPQ